MIKNVELKELKNPKFVKPIQMSFEQNGKVRTWEMVEVFDSVAVLLVDEKNQDFIIVKQFRPPIFLKNGCGMTYELCAGIVDKQKSLEQIAIEEVLEETGYEVMSLQKITSFYTGVGFNAAKQTLFFAKVNDEQKKSSGGGIDDEQIEVIRLKLSEAKKFIFDEQKPKTPGLIFAFYWYFNLSKACEILR